MTELQLSFEKVLEKRKASHKAEAEMLKLYGWEDLGVQGETIRWWFHELFHSNAQEDAVRLTLHFYKRDVLKSPKCWICRARDPEMKAGNPRCMDETGCQRRVRASE